MVLEMYADFLVRQSCSPSEVPDSPVRCGSTACETQVDLWTCGVENFNSPFILLLECLWYLNYYGFIYIAKVTTFVVIACLIVIRCAPVGKKI